MYATHARIIVADQASTWRSALVNALEEVESAVRVTEYGHELRRALEEVSYPPKIVVVGEVLRGIGGVEALYLADRTLALEERVRPAWPTRAVSLITEVRSDAELLDLYRRRGVTQFIYRVDPIERTVAALLANLKPASRTMVRIDAVAQLEGGVVAGCVYDISHSGAQLVLVSKDVPRPPPVGSRIELDMSFRHRSIRCAGEVRRLGTKVSSQGLRLIVGLQFAAMDKPLVSDLERMIEEAAEEFEMTRETDPSWKFA